MMWRPIDSAPKDGTKIDVWVIEILGADARKVSDEYRLTEVRWSNGKWMMTIEDGDFAGEDREIEWSVLTHVKESHWPKWEDEMYRAIKVTHWMPIPEPPQ